MTTTVDVLVVGAGVVGASVAWHLRARGVRDVLVVDRGDAAGAGSTSRATGGTRAQFGTEVNVCLSLLAQEKLRRFAAETGVDPGYQRVGYVFVARSDDGLAGLVAALAVQRRAGLQASRLVQAAEIAQLAPGISMEGVVGGSFCPTDGFVRPMEILRGYLGGARVEYGRAVTGLRLEGDRVVEVATTSGPISAGVVVNAAGAWAAELGVDLPVRPEPRHVLPATGAGALAPDHPMTIFVEDGFHFRVRDGRALVLSPDGIDEAERLARARVPALAGVPFDRAAAWSGLYEMSPDGHALLGRAPGLANLILANGSSGHGVMHAPALGHLVAELIVDGTVRSMDIHPLRPERFLEGDPVRGVELL